MRRYKFLTKEDVYTAFNRLRDAFLAAKDGKEVEEIINGILTYDEKLKIGRRILIAQYIKLGIGIDQIARTLKVGKGTIVSVMKNLDNPTWLDLIEKREEKVEETYQRRKHRLVGGSTLVFKKREYTGFKRKDVTR